MEEEEEEEEEKKKERSNFNIQRSDKEDEAKRISTELCKCSFEIQMVSQITLELEGHLIFAAPAEEKRTITENVALWS